MGEQRVWLCKKYLYQVCTLSQASNMVSPSSSYCISRGGGSVFTVVNM